MLWEMPKTAARDAWREIEPGLTRIAYIVTAKESAREPSHLVVKPFDNDGASPGLLLTRQRSSLTGGGDRQRRDHRT